MMKFHQLFIFLLAFFFVSSSQAASKIDTIYFQNGDRITGEIKSLEDNLLKFSTNDAGTLKVEWAKIDSVYVLNPMKIIMENGNFYFGKLFPIGKINKCILINQNGENQILELDKIVKLYPLEKKLTERLRGTLSTGISYTKASEITIFNFNGNITHISQKNIMEFDYNHIRTIDKDKSTSQRQNGSASIQRAFQNKWFLVGIVSAESNSEFELDLRTTAAIGGGNNILLTNSDHLYAAVGIMANREFSDVLRQNNLEGILRINYTRYIYDSPKVTLNVEGDIMPSLNVAGRIRSEIDSNLKWEVLDDFFLKWTFYHSFDSKPLSEGAEKTDWGITFGFEYKI